MTTTLFDLDKKVALVTGASRGIGEEIAKLFAQQGAHVIVASRKIDDCQSVADSIIDNGGSAQAISCHIGDMQQINELFEKIKDQHGKLDILVNNAATNPYFGHILDTDLTAFNKTIEVNIRGYFFMSIEAGKLMRNGGGGCIINTASVHALQPGAGQAIYSMTKAAVVNLTKAMAKECASFGIRCNAILPGLTKTKFSGVLFSDDSSYNSTVQDIPMKRHAEANEMAGTALYLASKASSYTNGECIVVDGGLTI